MFDMRFSYFATDDELPLYIQQGGHDSYMFSHEHVDFYELVLVTSGSALHVVGDKTEIIQKGDILIMSQGSGHAYENPEKLRLINLMFRPEMLARFEDEFVKIDGYKQLFSDKSNGLRLSLSDYEEIREILATMEKEYSQRNDGRKALVYTYFIQLVIYLSRLYGMPVKKREISGITAAAAYLEEHYMDDQPLKGAIGQSNYSRRHFCRLFTEVYGVSPQDYLFGVRMKRSMELLRTGLSVAETAGKCGFSDSGYFTRVFKKRFGVLPSHYRAGKD